MLIANHQRFADIPLIGVTWNRYGRGIPRFIMRHNLPSAYLRLGGIPVWRSSEVRDHAKKLQKPQRKLFLSDAHDCYGLMAEYTALCLDEGQDVCLFPSGSRHSTEYHTGGIETLVDAYRHRTTSPLSVVPLAITYTQRPLRSRVAITAGAPLLCENTQDVACALQTLRAMTDNNGV